MADQLLMFLFIAVIGGVSAVWAFVWIKTFNGDSVLSLIGHTVLFSFLSLFILYLIASLMFSGVDETYSFSNKSALGLGFFGIASIFIIACLIAFFSTIGKLLDNNNNNKDNKEQ